MEIKKMQEFMQAYKDNTEDIEEFLQETIKNTGDMASKEESNFKHLFGLFPHLNLFISATKRVLCRPHQMSTETKSVKHR